MNALQGQRTVLGFDFGMVTIGVAVGQELLGKGTALPPLKAREGKPDWQQLQKLVRRWHPDLLVVGLPLNTDGSSSHMARQARRFAMKLQGRLGLPCVLQDERFTTSEARNRRREGFDETASLDSVAAGLIVQDWFDAVARQKSD